ncbi:MAG TPA: hypothetical protein VFQ35_28975, partial [Polyangiaceae bacterium]|nr:hypothetical protein [Polyangiaceae bacterium]
MRREVGLFAMVVATLGAFAGCLPKPEPSASELPVTRAAPLADDGVERVARFSVTLHGSILDPDDAWLFRGALSDYHVGRINRRELPETLSERRVAVNAWFDPELAQTWIAPVAELAAGEVYSLAAPGWGRLAQVTVRAESTLPLLKRLWPPAGRAGGSVALYCGAIDAIEPAVLELEPSHLRAQVIGVVGSLSSGERCVELDFDDVSLPLEWQLPPPLAASVLWDSLPLEFQP